MEPTSLPSHQTALIVQGPGKLAIQHDVSVPQPSSTGAIVKVAAVAINPVDAKILDFSPAVGAIHGHDFAGTIVSLGPEAPGYLSVGDRVTGTAHGNNSLEPGNGAFSEYVAAEGDLILKIPDTMSFADAATVGIGLGTALLCIFQELGLAGPLYPCDPSRGEEFVLVAGGSTATGTRTIQLLKL